MAANSREGTVNYKSYLGNENLKRRGVAVEWTQERIEEFQKCAKDPIYFSENYVYIVHVDHGFIKIKPYDYQKEIIKKVQQGRKCAVVTSRQAGKTTTAVCLILHFVLFNSHKRVALLAYDAESAREILGRIQEAYEALPKWLQQGVVEWNKGSVEFENGSKIIAAATTSKSIRGKSCALIYIDETAFVDNWDTFFRAVYPTISSGDTTKILLTSTPNGLNHFHKTVKNARKKGTKDWNGYELVEVPWWKVPGRDEQWKKDTLEAMDFDYDAFEVEYNNEFMGSSGTLITGTALKALAHETPIQKNEEGLKQYRMPVKDHTYAITVDVSRGKGLDHHAFSVIDITEMPYQQVCTFYNNTMTPGDFAAILKQVATFYNEASVLVEINDNGEQVATTLFEDLEYENMLFTENAGRAGKRLSAGFSSKADKGLRTTKNTKAIGCSMLKMLIEQQQLIINDHDTIRELSTFSKKKSSYEAEAGHNDDLVMTLVIFAWLTDQKYFKELTDINTVESLREMNDDHIMNELTPFGIISDGHDEYENFDIPRSSKGDSFLLDDHDPYYDDQDIWGGGHF